MRLKILFFLPLSGLRSSEHITGLNVRATIVDIITETAIVMVNWR